MAVKGGATTMSHDVMPETSAEHAEENPLVSGCVLNIFQLPAMTRLRVTLGMTLATLSSGLSVSASTPGSLAPARNSSEAPPPVEMWEIRAATPDWCTA